MRHVALALSSPTARASRPAVAALSTSVRAFASSSSSSSSGRGRGAGVGSTTGGSGENDGGESAETFKLPQSLTHADDGRFDDPEELSRSRVLKTSSSTPLTLSPGAKPPSVASPKGAGRGKALAAKIEALLGPDTSRRGPGRGGRGSRPGGRPGIDGRGRGKPIEGVALRSLLPAEIEGDRRNPITPALRAKAAGRGSGLKDAFSDFKQREAIDGTDDAEDGLIFSDGREQSRGARRAGGKGVAGGRGGRGGRGRPSSAFGASVPAESTGPPARAAVGAGRRRGRRGGVDGEDAVDDVFEGMLDTLEGAAADGHDQDDSPFGGFNMREIRSLVMEAQSVFPMRIPKPKGLAKVLNPEAAAAPPQYDHRYPWGLQPFDFAPIEEDLRPGRYRPSQVDRLLSTHEVDAATVLAPVQALSTVDSWFDALQLPEGSRMRRNPRFVRVLEEFAHPSKYSDAQKRQMLYALKFGLACDPDRAGYENGKLPFEVPGFDPSEMESFQTPKRGGA